MLLGALFGETNQICPAELPEEVLQNATLEDEPEDRASGEKVRVGFRGGVGGVAGTRQQQHVGLFLQPEALQVADAVR